MRVRTANEVLGHIKTPEDGYKALCSAIVLQACDDYVRAISLKEAMTIASLEKFFRSERFLMFSNGLDGSYIVRKLKEMSVAYVNPTEAKPVESLDEQGTVQNRYDSIAEAAWSVSGDRRTIRRACESGAICYGFKWRYARQ